jgi:HEAT repeat protein
MDRIEMLVELVSPASDVRLTAARRILKIPAEKLESLGLIEKGRLLLALEASLTDSQDEVRAAAVEIAGRLGSCGRLIITQLIQALQNDPKVLVRASAAEALPLIRKPPRDEFDPMIVAALSNAVRDDPHVVVREKASHSLRLFSTRIHPK